MGCKQDNSVTLNVPPCIEENCVSVGIPGKIFLIKQDYSYACWAAVLTMMKSWQEQKPLDVKATVKRYGQKYADLYLLSKVRGIPAKDEIELYELANMNLMRQLNPSINGWAEFLEDFGPLSITIDSRAPDGGTIHALLMVGIQGSIDGKHTNVYIVDPLAGKLQIMPFMEFLNKYEAHFAVDWPIQVIHFPKKLSGE